MEQAVTRNRAYARASGLGAAWAAFALGLIYAVASAYWGLGGSWLLDTVGAPWARPGRSASAAVAPAVSFVIGLKVIATVLPLLAVSAGAARVRLRYLIRALACTEAAILTVYGLNSTAVGLLVQAGLIGTPANADHPALAWHAFPRGPGLLVLGVLGTAALFRSR